MDLLKIFEIATGGPILRSARVPRPWRDEGARNVWRNGATDERPVYSSEERVLLDLRRAPGGGQALRGVFDEEPSDEILGGSGGTGTLRCLVIVFVVVWKMQCLGNDIGEGSIVVGAAKRSPPVEKLEDENSEGPPVDSVAVALTGYDLRRQVLVCAHERHGASIGRLGEELQSGRGRGRAFCVAEGMEFGRLRFPSGEMVEHRKARNGCRLLVAVRLHATGAGQHV